MVGRPRTRRRRAQRVSGLQYFRARKTSIIFFLLFLGGLTLGSFYAVNDGANSLVVVSIVVNSLKVQQEAHFPALFFQSMTQCLGILVYLYFAAYCVKGKWLIYLTPLVFGVSVGAITTSILSQFGTPALLYTILCIFTPKFLQFFLLLALCNNCLRISSALGGGNAETRGNIFWVFAIVFLVFSLIESCLIFQFCGLVTLTA